MYFLSKTKFKVFLEIAKVCNHKLLGDYKSLQAASFVNEKNICLFVRCGKQSFFYELIKEHDFVIKPSNSKNKNDVH